jgi:CubicO group peptidase (beta-lactamase class C family)
MNRLILIIQCCFVAILFACKHQPSASSHQEVDAIFSRWHTADANTPGCALAVIHQGEIIHSKGYGMADIEHNIPITPQSIFYIGSVSKQFVATALLLLEEEGKLSLEDDIRKYIPELPDYGHTIRLHHLIHHTSGLRDNLTLWEMSGRSMIDDIPEKEIFELICRQQGLNFIPGEDYAYSNTCYYLMSIVIERVSGQSLRDFAREKIFTPLGMKHSQFNDDNQRIISQRAFGYTQLAEDSIGNLIMRFDLVGSGGLYSSIEDLYLWDQNFYHNQLGKRGQALIDQLQTNGRYNNGEEVDYAYAMINGEYRGLRTIHHTGSMGGYRAVYLRFPDEEFSVIILGNVDNLNPLTRAYEVASVYLRDKLGPEPPKPEEKANASASTKQESYEVSMHQFTGKFYSPELNTYYKLKYEPEEEKISLTNPKGNSTILHITNRSELSNSTYKITFDKNFQTFNMNYAGIQGIIFNKLANTTANE